MKYSTLSKAGDRDINEDYVDVFNSGDRAVFLLADGLGGHGYGEIASREAVETVRKHFVSNENKEPRQLLEEAFENAHSMMKKLQNEVGNDSFFKTTLVVLVITGEYAVWGHIGDSRIYHFENGKLIERSMDHSVPQMLCNTGHINESQIRHHEDRNRLTRVLGSDDQVSKPYISDKEPIGEGSAFLLCSDGFWEHIRERNMEKTLKKADAPSSWLKLMEKTVVKKGRKYNMDNYSAVAVFSAK